MPSLSPHRRFGCGWGGQEERRGGFRGPTMVLAALAVSNKRGGRPGARRGGMVRYGGFALALCLYHAGICETFTSAVEVEPDTGGGEQLDAWGAPLVAERAGASAELFLDGAREVVTPLRRLQVEMLGTGNATNLTTLYSACELEIMADVGIEQCQIDYRRNDCPDAVTKNWITWVDLSGGVYFVHIFGVLVMFMALSVVCDEFFVPGTTPPPRARHRRQVCPGLTVKSRSLSVPLPP